MADYVKLAATAKRLIEKNGRQLKLYQLDQRISVPKWKGTGAQVLLDPPLEPFGVFVVPQTSIPTESRGLAYDWIDASLFSTCRHVVIIPALGMPADMRDYKIMLDNGEQQGLIWGQSFKPGPIALIHVFGTRE